MKEALSEAYTGIENKHGGPVRSVIVKDGKIVGKGHNKVLLKSDSTCHGKADILTLKECERDECLKLFSEYSEKNIQRY